MCKTEVIFKAQISKRKPREEWIQVENTHEPLVSQEDFDTANAKILSRKRQQKSGEVSIFQGLLNAAPAARLCANGIIPKTVNTKSFFAALTLDSERTNAQNTVFLR